ncbi:MAG: AraC family transcriptional regulator [Lachnospiraceae bacterium]
MKTLKIECCDPKFLFTWQGTRYETEEKHCHDFFEMAYIMSGSGKYSVDDELVDVTEGDLLIFNPGVQHKAIPVEGAEQPTTEFFVGFTEVKLVDYPWNFIPFATSGNVIHTTGELKQKLFKICVSMAAEQEVFKVGRYFMLKAYLVQMLTLVIREHSAPLHKPHDVCSFDSVNKKYVVGQIVNYFEDHYNEKVSLDRIAENMYLSPFYISKIFKSEIGEAPIAHLINIRLEKARELLEKDETLTVQKIAVQVGYEDAYYFSRLFKKKYGMSPSQLRKTVNNT